MRAGTSGSNSKPPAPRSGSTTPGCSFYRAVATGPTIDKIVALDFVLFVELIGLTSPAHDQSTPLIDADMIRPGISFGLTRFGGGSIPVGILDSGFADGVTITTISRTRTAAASTTRTRPVAPSTT